MSTLSKVLIVLFFIGLFVGIFLISYYFINLVSGHGSGNLFGSSCKDTDGGQNIYKQGSVQIRENGRFIIGPTDNCVDSSGEKFGITHVKEYYCEGNGNIGYSITECPSGYFCRQGACVEKSEFCNENDGGKNIFKKGITSFLTGSGHIATGEDHCDDNKTIVENYCDFRYGAAVYENSETIQCPYGYHCSDGACVLDNSGNNKGGSNFGNSNPEIPSSSGSGDMPPPPPE